MSTTISTPSFPDSPGGDASSSPGSGARGRCRTPPASANARATFSVVGSRPNWTLATDATRFAATAMASRSPAMVTRFASLSTSKRRPVASRSAARVALFLPRTRPSPAFPPQSTTTSATSRRRGKRGRVVARTTRDASIPPSPPPIPSVHSASAIVGGGSPKRSARERIFSSSTTTRSFATSVPPFFEPSIAPPASSNASSGPFLCFLDPSSTSVATRASRPRFSCPRRSPPAPAPSPTKSRESLR